MKRIISVLLCCAMLGPLCACQHVIDLEKRTPVPRFDVTASYSFTDKELTNDDGVPYYRQSLGTAQFSSKDEHAAERINASLAELYVKFKADAEYTQRVAEDQTEGEIIELSYRCTPSVTRCDTRALSIVFDVSQDIGGLHADFTRISRSYDSDSGTLLSLADIAKNEEQLKTFIKNYVIGLAAGDEYKENGESSGVLLFEIPYSALEEFLSMELAPVDYEGENGMILADNGFTVDRDSLKLLDTVTVDAEGQSVVLSAEETVYNVRVYTESRTLWQRNYLTSGTEVVRGIYQSGKDGSILLVDLRSSDIEEGFAKLWPVESDEVRNF